MLFQNEAGKFRAVIGLDSAVQREEKKNNKIEHQVEVEGEEKNGKKQRKCSRNVVLNKIPYLTFHCTEKASALLGHFLAFFLSCRLCFALLKNCVWRVLRLMPTYMATLRRIIKSMGRQLIVSRPDSGSSKDCAAFN